MFKKKCFKCSSDKVSQVSENTFQCFNCGHEWKKTIRTEAMEVQPKIRPKKEIKILNLDVRFFKKVYPTTNETR
jgi:ribosomal protein L37AE/L43A